MGSIFLLNFSQNLKKQNPYIGNKILIVLFYEFSVQNLYMIEILCQQYAYSFEITISSGQKWLEVLNSQQCKIQQWQIKSNRCLAVLFLDDQGNQLTFYEEIEV